MVLQKEEIVSISCFSLATFQSHGMISHPGNLCIKAKTRPTWREGSDLYHVLKAKGLTWPKQGIAVETEGIQGCVGCIPSGVMWP